MGSMVGDWKVFTVVLVFEPNLEVRSEFAS